MCLGPPARCPFSPPFLGEGSPTKIDYRKRGTLILTSLLEDLCVHVKWGAAVKQVAIHQGLGLCLIWGLREMTVNGHDISW